MMFVFYASFLVNVASLWLRDRRSIARITLATLSRNPVLLSRISPSGIPERLSAYRFRLAACTSPEFVLLEHLAATHSMPHCCSAATRLPSVWFRLRELAPIHRAS